MPTYLYCILPAVHELPAHMPAGIGGGPARELGVGAVTAWVASVPSRVITPTLEGVRAHDAVTQAALASGVTPLPVRFGQTFESDDDCRDALRAREPRLLTDLERVRGLVEMRVLIALTVPSASGVTDDPGTPGRAYMQQLMRTRSREQIVQDAAVAAREHVSSSVRTLIREEAFVVSSSPVATLTVSHLIARADVPAYRAILEGAAPGTLVERLVVCGPFAPYQFVSPPA